MENGKNQQEEEIKKKYLTPGSTAGFTTLTAFMQNTKFKNKKDVETALSKLDAFSLHKQRRKKFPRSKIIVTEANQTLSGDLGFMQDFKGSNKNNIYFLVLVDVFSNVMYARALKKKDGKSVLTALESILKNFPKMPQKIWTDQGGLIAFF